MALTASQSAPLSGAKAEPISDASAWQPREIGTKADLASAIDPHHIALLVDAARASVAKGRGGADVALEHFSLDGPLAPMAEAIEGWRREVFRGRGFALLTGVPVDTLAMDELESLYFGLGSHFGSAVSQSNLGDRIGHVTNIGGKDRRERAYRNSRELTMHTDRCDVIGMLCVRKAKTGGLSGYTSAHAIYNAMLEERPDLLEPLVRGFRYHRFGEQPPDQPQVTSHEVPIFSRAEGCTSVIFLRTYIEMAARELDTPLTDTEIEALDYFEHTAARDDLRLRFMLEPGDVVFFNNCTMLHHRTAFEDGGDPSANRLLLRLWLMSPQYWPRTNAHAQYKGQGIAARAEGSTYYDGSALTEPVQPAAG